jgi:hypothetical protein
MPGEGPFRRPVAPRTQQVWKIVMPKYPFATMLLVCVSAIAALPARAASAASPYAVDGIALGASVTPAREYQCGPSEEFGKYTWCQRRRQEKGKRGTFSSTSSILHGRGGSVAYVNREIQPAFFIGNDIQAEIKRLSTRFGAPARETRLPEREDHANAVIALWGSVQLDELDAESRSALESGALSQQSLLVDHLGDVRQSLQLGLPVYRLKGGSGYLWSAASDRGGRGHLRFLAIDVPALAATNDVAVAAPRNEATVLTPTKDVTALAAASDLRPFLTPQPTSIVTTIMPNDAGKSSVSPAKDKPQQSIVQKTRIDADRARILDAERLAAEEIEKARMAWARFEADKAAYEARDRMKWTIIASFFILLAILGLLRIMTREESQAASAEGLRNGRKADQAAACSRPQRGPALLQRAATSFAALMVKARAAMTHKTMLAAPERS